MAITFKIIIAAITGVLGIYAAIVGSRDSDGRLTKSGRWLAIAIAFSTILSIGLLLQERIDEVAREDTLRQQFARQLTKQEVTLQQLRNVVTRQESLVRTAQDTLHQVGSVDRTLLANVQQTADIQRRTTSNLTTTKNVLKGVNRLLTPFSVAAIEVSITYNIDEQPDLATWWGRLQTYTNTERNALQKTSRIVGDYEIRDVSHAREYHENRLVGIRLSQNSPYWPRNDDWKASQILGCACLKVWFETNDHKTSGAAIQAVDGAIGLPQYPALGFAIEDDPWPVLSWLPLSPKQLREVNDQWLSRERIVPGVQIAVDLDNRRVTRHVVLVHPQPVLNTKRINSALDLVGGTVWYEIPEERVSYGAKLTTMRLFLDDGLSSFVDLPLTQFVAPSHYVKSTRSVLWRTNLHREDLNVRSFRQ